ncbi:hypothetical protein OIU74_000356 [Salix koriyanagi]|uniref:Uncharacterized protein n=1 Tax=Salix koriyanagi TaxID=2511006 RepID=A0A9Q0WZX2_9ROSI|nr:hypothetical protein OIU74_000356 [Salix koriyanagi]
MGSDNNNNNVINRKDYILLKDFRKEIEVENEKNFSISFWVYLINSSTAAFPAAIIKQVYSDISSNAPFLVLNEKKKMTPFSISPCTQRHYKF